MEQNCIAGKLIVSQPLGGVNGNDISVYIRGKKLQLCVTCSRPLHGESRVLAGFSVPENAAPMGDLRQASASRRSFKELYRITLGLAR